MVEMLTIQSDAFYVKYIFAHAHDRHFRICGPLFLYRQDRNAHWQSSASAQSFDNDLHLPVNLSPIHRYGKQQIGGRPYGVEPQ
jgi:hypothetical protein